MGCADLRAPHDAWLRRDGDDLVVGCHSSSQTWHLRCIGRRWSGVIGNCSIRQYRPTTLLLCYNVRETVLEICEKIGNLQLCHTKTITVNFRTFLFGLVWLCFFMPNRLTSLINSPLKLAHFLALSYARARGDVSVCLSVRPSHACNAPIFMTVGSFTV